MKKFLLLMSAALFCVALQAQNANRSGLFVELGGGFTAGDSPNQAGKIVSEFVPSTDNNAAINLYRKVDKTSGACVDLGVGYRWATSLHFAFEVKLQAMSHVSNFTETLAINLKPGVRYTSREIIGTTSLYANANAGLGAFVDNTTLSVPYEVGVGFNFGNNISAGLVWDAQYAVSKHEYHGAHYGMAGIRLGYRF